jgi:hypothetical protein
MQDSIVLEWTRYASMLVRPTKKIQPQIQPHTKNRNYFRLPMKSDDFDYVPEQVYTHLLCTEGINYILDFSDSASGGIRQLGGRQSLHL